MYDALLKFLSEVVASEERRVLGVVEKVIE
jgi:hypothetical protein